MTETIVRILFLIGIFVAVFLLAQTFARSAAQKRSYSSAINRRMSLIQSGAERDELVAQLLKNSPREQAHLPPIVRGIVENFQRTIFASAIPYSASQVTLFMVIAGVIVVGLVLLTAATLGTAIGFGVIQLAIIFAFALAFGVPYLILQRIAAKRQAKVEKQFPVALDIFVRSLRSGHPVSAGIDLLTHEMEDPIGTEFGIVADEVTYGADLISALNAMADRWNLEDMRMFVTSLAVQSETGGNLAEILESLAGVIRERHSMYMKVRALSSEGRMTGWMLSVLPVGAFVMTFLGSPEFYLDVVDDPLFQFIAFGLVTLYFIGVFIIRKMIDIKV